MQGYAVLSLTRTDQAIRFTLTLPRRQPKQTQIQRGAVPPRPWTLNDAVFFCQRPLI